MNAGTRADATSPARGGRGRSAVPTDAGEWSILIALAIAVGAGLFFRFSIGWDRQLWFDEMFTAVIASNDTISGFFRDVTHEVGGLFYYGFMWIWVHLFGASNFALRLPGMLLSIAGPLLILWRGPKDRTLRYTWTALAFVAFPLLLWVSAARAYPLLFFLSCYQILAFRDLVASPDRGAAIRWSIVSALMILTHFFSAPLVAAEGLAILIIHRQRALPLWPALFAFVPVLVWAPMQFSMLLNVSGFNNWPRLTLTGSSLAILAMDIVGLGRWARHLLLFVAAVLAFDLFRLIRHHRPLPYDRRDMIVAGVVVTAMLLLIGIGFLKPFYQNRYLIAYLPGVLLGLALVAKRLGSVSRFAPAVLVLGFAGWLIQTNVQLLRAPTAETYAYWEDAADSLQESGVSKVYFLWQGLPTGLSSDTSLNQRIARFFFERDRFSGQVEFRLFPTAQTPQGSEMARSAEVARTVLPGEGFIWITTRTSTDALGDLAGRIGRNTGAGCRDRGTPESLAIIECVKNAGVGQ